MHPTPQQLLLDALEVKNEAEEKRLRLGRMVKRVAVRNCKTCGGELDRKRAMQGSLFCNSKCYGKWLTVNNRGPVNGSWKTGPVHLRCERCNKPFEISAASFRLHGRKYCSSICSGLARMGTTIHAARTGTLVPCATCGKEFYLQPCERKRGRKYCSGKCNPHTIRPGQFAKEKHPMWRGEARSQDMRERDSLEYAQWRSAVMRRDRYTCQECGRRGGKLSAHHIKKFSKYPALRFFIPNGITLCWDCHRKINGHEHKHEFRFQSKITSLF